MNLRATAQVLDEARLYDHALFAGGDGKLSYIYPVKSRQPAFEHSLCGVAGDERWFWCDDWGGGLSFKSQQCPSMEILNAP